MNTSLLEVADLIAHTLHDLTQDQTRYESCLGWWIFISCLRCDAQASEILNEVFPPHLSDLAQEELRSSSAWSTFLDRLPEDFFHFCERGAQEPPPALTLGDFLRINTALSENLKSSMLGALYEQLMNMPMKRSGHKVIGGSSSRILGDQRRSRGAYYTDAKLCQEVVSAALSPVLSQINVLPHRERAEAILKLTLCDLSMGAGAFLIEALEQLVTFYVSHTSLPRDEAFRQVAQCIYGVDTDPIAVMLARFNLRFLTGDSRTLSTQLLLGDALLGKSFTPEQDLSYTPLPHHPPFHWDEAYPQVQSRGGFDILIGNPPFLGGRQTSVIFGKRYVHALQVSYPASQRSADLCAFFFRRAFNLCREGGSIGLIGTNTIAQGVTRESGLRQIIRQNGSIYYAWRRRMWGGDAAVCVSLVCILKGAHPHSLQLDGLSCSYISSALTSDQIELHPVTLSQNINRCFQGSILLGMGFTFSESPQKGEGSLQELEDLLREDPTHQQLIKPYLGGKALNTDPQQRPPRFVIDFGGMTLEEARAWPKLLALVEKRVAPQRKHHRNALVRVYPWWRHWNRRILLTERLRDQTSALVTNAQASLHLCFTFVPANVIFANSINVIPDASYAEFAVLQSRVHELWAWRFSSTLGDQLRYNPTKCFETFPFPAPDQLKNLTLIGERYHQVRASFMANQELRDAQMGGNPPEGLTATYNRFHDPHCKLEGILSLRDLHAELDQAVINAYGWTDLQAAYQWLDQYSGLPLTISNYPQAKLSKDLRPRWMFTPELRSELLRRLVILNQEYSEADAGRRHE